MMALKSIPNRKQPLKTINKSYGNDLKPLDFSFRSLKYVSDIIGDDKREESCRSPHDIEELIDEIKQAKATTIGDIDHEEDEEDFPNTAKPINCFADSSGKRHRKSRSKCLRLNNNSLETIVGLKQIVFSLFLRPLQLSWLDLSFNLLTNVPEELNEFHCLQILYLHGNCLENLSEVEKFRPMTNLKKLTLHGNPIEKVKHYRVTVLTTVPTLIEFDFSSVVKSERENAEVWLKNTTCTTKRRRPRYHLRV
ncbi:leucine-rich repeat-containing protein 51 isoform X1 [Octopus sinensis]|uniref:Leucine-rich repeat-containing protein 51 n=2 Tax=Octopus sinensis TaxID=2607531 RepID=A0A6P7TEM2_9MOLL|nr:leucine-rich repeat-containing protein 51 isoform X1 [Octopus sinensis]